jgi:hypothetical protein
MRDLLVHLFVPEAAVIPDVLFTRMGMGMDTCADIRRGTSIGSRTSPTARTYLPAVLTSTTNLKTHISQHDKQPKQSSQQLMRQKRKSTP